MTPAPAKLLVVLTHGAANDRATIAFTAANAALSAGMEVAVFLTSDGVDLARDGAAGLNHVPPFQTLAELMDRFVAEGGVLLACGSCCQHRALASEAMRQDVRVSGMATMTEWLLAGARTLSF